MKLFPYQEKGVKRILKAFKTQKGFLLADDMGLGKTVQGISVARSINDLDNILVVCPSSLKLNWEKEFKKFAKHEFAFCRVDKIKQEIDFIYAEPTVYIMSYAIFSKRDDNPKNWDLVIFDEAHYLKNPSAKRTKKAKDTYFRTKKACKFLFMTGTPIVNYVNELFFLCNLIAGERVKYFQKWSNFVWRYCEPKETRWGWEFKGKKNLQELKSYLDQFVWIRRKKKQVLKNLPDKICQIIPVETDKAKIKKLAQDLINFIKDNPVKFKKSEAGFTLEDLYEMIENESWDKIPVSPHLASARRLIAESKIKGSIKFIKEILEQKNKVVIFAHHKDIISELKLSLKRFNPVSITGTTKNADRDLAVEKFQNDEETKVFIGNIKAAGVGLTLTASDTVIFVESDWSPSNMEQAEDRCYRIGTKNTVNVFYLTADHSLDHAVNKVLTNKKILVRELENN